MKLYKEDIKRIGSTVYNNNSYTSFICSQQTANIEYILLREILQLFGDYTILSESDFIWGNGSCDLEICTNMPYDVYLSAK